MPIATLRVLAKGVAQVPNYEAQEGGRNARVSHVCLPLGPEFHDEETHTKRRHAAFVKRVGEVVTVPDRAEYRRHLRDGDLYPADGETAAAAGVKFDPSFGEEHDDSAMAEHVAALKEMAGENKELLGHIARFMLAPPQSVPPVDNQHVAPGAEQFSAETTALNHGDH